MAVSGAWVPDQQCVTPSPVGSTGGRCDLTSIQTRVAEGWSAERGIKPETHWRIEFAYSHVTVGTRKMLREPVGF